MKKLKLVMSIATMCLAIAVLCFGVLAATSVTYTIEGTISYAVEDVYVDVNTTVYKSVQYLSATEQSSLVETLGDPANLSSAQTTYELVDTGVSYSFSTVNNFTPAKSGLSFNFDLETKTYVIVTNVKNLTANNAWAVVDSRTSTSTNVKIVDNYQLEISKTTDTNGKNVVIVVTPTDVTQPIDSGTFTFNLVFGSNEYVNSTTNMSKMTIAEDKSVTKASDNISGVLEIPGDCVIKNGNSLKSSFRNVKISHLILDNGIMSIGNAAFNGCRGIISIIFENYNQLTTIGSFAFSYCSSLTSITIPSSVTTIGSSAFNGCISLTSITIPEGVTSIGNSAFYACSSLTNVTIPSSVTSIGQSAFFNCINLKTVYITDLAKWCGISFGDSSSNPLYNGANLYLNETLVTDLEIPSSVTSIVDYAFCRCIGLTSINIPSSVTSIGIQAFYSCDGLTSINIPSSVTSLGERAFAGCSGLESITVSGTGGTYTAQGNCLIKGTELVVGCKNSIIPTNGSVTSIGSYAFYYCIGLTSINIPSSVTSIGSSAFQLCSSLTTINFTGTQAQWNAISGLSDASIRTGVNVVCTDGTIVTAK